jgi:hypothetical protein
VSEPRSILPSKEVFRMNKTKVGAALTVIGAGVWVWRHRGPVEQARDELNETGRIQPGTALALGLFALGAMMLWPDVQKAWRQLGR